ncbi:hypothetical protein AYI75_21090 [Shewanella algae]|uniref:hypothetical protein n=1 Tax=Shewanella algae TaxID=38313 RepID=UPI0011AAF683|nr:hypothetical protein [Shewanella algae]TWO82390.1 hypothetical protein AYI75_21090 [Shewanella algae]
MSIFEDIKSNFHPEIYSKQLETQGDFKLCLIKNKFIARYCLAVFEFNENKPIGDQIVAARKEIFKVTKALWCVREVGVYMVFLASKAPTQLRESELAIDKTGFHAVIVQGVHIIGPKSFHLYNHSKWLSHTFGGANEISSKLQAITT